MSEDFDPQTEIINIRIGLHGVPVKEHIVDFKIKVLSDGNAPFKRPGFHGCDLFLRFGSVAGIESAQILPSRDFVPGKLTEFVQKRVLPGDTMPEKRPVRQIIGNDGLLFMGIRAVNNFIILCRTVQDPVVPVQRVESLHNFFGAERDLLDKFLLLEYLIHEKIFCLQIYT